MTTNALSGRDFRIKLFDLMKSKGVVDNVKVRRRKRRSSSSIDRFSDASAKSTDRRAARRHRRGNAFLAIGSTGDAARSRDQRTDRRLFSRAELRLHRRSFHSRSEFARLSIDDERRNSSSAEHFHSVDVLSEDRRTNVEQSSRVDAQLHQLVVAGLGTEFSLSNFGRSLGRFRRWFDLR